MRTRILISAPVAVLLLIFSGCTFDPSGIEGCVDVCGDGDTTCLGSVLRQCVKNEQECWHWEDATDCAVTGLECVLWEEGAYCGPGCHCTPGETRCSEDGRSVEYCFSSKNSCYWKVMEDCDFDEACVADPSPSCSPQCPCTPGETRCSTDLGSIEECREGDEGCGWVTRQQCAPGTQCRDDGSPACVNCVACQEGEGHCENNTLVVCEGYGNGCTAENSYDCGQGSFCDPLRLQCVQCSPGCNEGDTECSSDGAYVLTCTTTSGGCLGYAAVEECAPQWLSACAMDATGAECVLHGDVCDDPVYVSKGTVYSIPGFGSMFGDDVQRVFMGYDDPRTDAVMFPLRWNFPPYGADAFFALPMARGETVTIRTSLPDAFIWATDTTCPATPINYEIGELTFGAPWDGTFVFGIEVPEGAQDLAFTIEDATTVCDIYGAPTLPDATEHYQELAIDATDTTVCLPFRRSWPGECVSFHPQAPTDIIAWTTSHDGRDAGPALNLVLYDERGNPVNAFMTGVLKAHYSPNWPNMGRGGYIHVHVDAKDYTLCIEPLKASDLIYGGRMPYVAVHMVFRDKASLHRPSPGEVEFSELMLNGAKDGGERFERNWVELSNKTDMILSLEDCTLRLLNTQGDEKKINSMVWDRNHAPIILPHSTFLVVGDSNEAREQGLLFDYINAAIKDAGAIQASIAILECNGVVVDRVELDPASLYAEPNVSVQLSSDATTNDATASWCLTPGVAYPAHWFKRVVGAGTPAGPNVPCSILDSTPVYEFDAASICASGEWMYIVRPWDGGPVWDHNVRCDQDGVVMEIPASDSTEIWFVSLRWSHKFDLRGHDNALLLVEYTLSPSPSALLRPESYRDFGLEAPFVDSEARSTPTTWLGRLSSTVVGRWRDEFRILLSRTDRDDSEAASARIRRLAIYAW